MSTLKKFRFPALIGAGVIAAGVLVYVSNTRINSRATEGAIGQRDVYRDAEVKTADVGTPGEAPVATKAILESKEFQSLAKNEAFHNLMADESFARLARNAQFLSMMRNAAFLRKLDSESFRQALRNGSKSELAPLEIEPCCGGISRLATNSEFQAFWKNRSDSHTLDLMRGSNFQRLLARSDFQSAMQRGMASSLASNLQPPDGLKSNLEPPNGKK